MKHGMKTRPAGAGIRPVAEAGLGGAWRALRALGLAAAAAVAPGLAGAAGPPAVNLGSAAQFAILAGSAISATVGGAVRGDVGLSPTTGAAITGMLTNQVDGVIYAIDAAGPAGACADPARLFTAKADLASAYSDAAGRTNAEVVYVAGGDIGGMNLGPGLYTFAGAASISGADVTLTGGVDDVWIFQVGTALTVGSGIRVVLAGGAQARNVFWQVGSSATLGTTSGFKGNLMVAQSITMDTGSAVEGRALACAAAVTFYGQCIGLPTPEAPRFTHIFRTNDVSATVILRTTPGFPLTLQACPDLLRTNWTTVVTEIPASNAWAYTDFTAAAAVTQRFYRAFITP